MEKDESSHRLHSHEYHLEKSSGERRTFLVIGLTGLMMIVEITAGLLTRSMALLADGWHMSTHMAALSITAFAYIYARRHASDERYTFGTGKVGTLGGFASAVFLALVAFLMMGESASRLFDLPEIRFNEAIMVAVIGLIVNLLSAMLLRGRHNSEKHDHNLRAAYLHVLADALTSLTAIFALTTGKYMGWVWMDPLMGIVGGVIILIWAYGLLKDTGRVLLDRQPDEQSAEMIKNIIETEADTRIIDLHVWRVGQSHAAAIISLLTAEPRPPEYYKELLADIPDLEHITVETHYRKNE
ncbi:MAG TPA: cation transporter [candidate division Zixibacteria bacterium]|nr:cation transporter [candidate division Zixibacteria bacterium]